MATKATHYQPRAGPGIRINLVRELEPLCGTWFADKTSFLPEEVTCKRCRLLMVRERLLVPEEVA